MDEVLKRLLKGKRVLILGFGREGQTSYTRIRMVFPEQPLANADRNGKLETAIWQEQDPRLEFMTGEEYLDRVDRYDVIIRSPGIPLKDIRKLAPDALITSQTDIFLRAFARQTIGITGTKGKSTTASLVAHLFTRAGEHTLLMGNIGIPPFSMIPNITPSTRIILELSSHQLQLIEQAPDTAILLNLFEEHLDAYDSFLEYQLAKMNIGRKQQHEQALIFHADDTLITQRLTEYPVLSELLPFSLCDEQEKGAFFRGSDAVVRINKGVEQVYPGIHNRYLRGDHNKRNILAALLATARYNLEEEAILDGLASFKGLAHRMEVLGMFHGILWVNDSIATIPEACMAAVQTLPQVDTLVLGGFDRGISYTSLSLFLLHSGVRNLILTGAAGRRIGEELEAADPMIRKKKRLFVIERFDDFFRIAIKVTAPGATCLLSPAAASYDEFRSFEERGFRFRQLITGESPPE